MTNSVDAHVGRRIKLLRKVRGLSQMTLAQGLGISFQQIQKYERGLNRVSASGLWRLAELLDCEVASFFAGLRGQDRVRSDGGDALGPIGEFLGTDGGLELARAYLAMPDKHRRALLAAARALAQA